MGHHHHHHHNDHNTTVTGSGGYGDTGGHINLHGSTTYGDNTYHGSVHASTGHDPSWSAGVQHHLNSGPAIGPTIMGNGGQITGAGVGMTWTF